VSTVEERQQRAHDLAVDVVENDREASWCEDIARDINAALESIRKPAPLVLATVSSGRFAFECVAETKTAAITSLLRAWEAHCDDYPTADGEMMSHWITFGDVNFAEIRIGDVHRDGETIYSRPAP
jgi:hypothetical protein